MPPGNILLLLVVSLILIKQKPRTGKTLIGISILALYLMSAPFFAGKLVDQLEIYPALEVLESVEQNTAAIVVLSGDRNLNAHEYEGPTVGKTTLERIRYGAYLQRKTGLTILVSGGIPDSVTGKTLAELMAQVLLEYADVGEVWLERRSSSTVENARFSQLVLKDKGIERIYLVTQAWHMPRAVYSFENTGLEIIPAPTGFTGGIPFKFTSLLPRANGLSLSRTSLREIGALVWYRILY